MFTQGCCGAISKCAAVFDYFSGSEARAAPICDSLGREARPPSCVGAGGGRQLTGIGDEKKFCADFDSFSVAEAAGVAGRTPEVDVSLENVVDTLERHRVKRLPVMRDGKLVGIVSRANLVQAFATVLPRTKGPRPEDSEIRRQILEEVDRQPWGATLVNVTVQDGVAELWGTVLDERERQALRVAVENVPGVAGIKDHRAFDEPYVGPFV